MKQPSGGAKAGFTIIELMVAMAISLVLAVVIYTIYTSQVQAQLTQELYTELQEGMRAAMILMEQEIRTAGADPMGTAGAGIITAGADELRFTRDVDGGDEDGRITYDGEIDAGSFPREDVRYARIFSDGRWQIGREIGGNDDDDLLRSLLDHVEVLDFVYLDRDGNPLPRPVPNNRLDEILEIEMTIVARSDREDGGWFMTRFTDTRAYENQQGDVIFWPDANNRNFRRLRMSTNITCRNMLN